MDDDRKAMITALLHRAGSIPRAAGLIGVTVRHVQKWVSGHSSPSRRSRRLIRIALDGDDVQSRECRIEEYARRAAREERLFA